MRDDFCVFVLTHGRADNVRTMTSLERAGYTGRIYVVIDDEDTQGEQYRKLYGDKVLAFSKQEIAATFDEGDLAEHRNTIVYARNATWGLAAEVGCRYFMQLDDDYHKFEQNFNCHAEYGYNVMTDMDSVIESMIEFLDTSQALTVAMSQGGDHLGGGGSQKAIKAKRKAMNTFLCDTTRPFTFVGRFNEDVNTYTELGRRGGLFFTLHTAKVVQAQTQAQGGGMTDFYLASGTYVKSFMAVMYSPSCVKISTMGPGNPRIHHHITWDHTAPKIVHERHRGSRYFR